ncbi:hypothetical protein ACFW2Y_10435 [Streptomyces sp. NPDC058877]|uniref:hypothetical protein n=1 Tax=unclassified Streptomyces TaxID=2593676 RepID=UPI0036A850C0
MNRTLVCSVVDTAVVALDGTVLTVAEPALQRDLHAHVGQVQWTSTGCLVAVAASWSSRAASATVTATSGSAPPEPSASPSPPPASPWLPTSVP